MKLEIGKRYRSRRGHETGPLFRTDDHTNARGPVCASHPFGGYFSDDDPWDGFRAWAPDGKHWYAAAAECDLIEEIAD
jgi:hypothetical protein